MFSMLTTGFGRTGDGARLSAKRRAAAFAMGSGPSPHFRADLNGGAARTLLAAALISVSSAAYSHSSYPHDCCHDGDCRPVPCDELVETRNGIMWRGVVLFNDAQVKPSQDRFCHVCAKEQKGSSILPFLPLCAFVQPSS